MKTPSKNGPFENEGSKKSNTDHNSDIEILLGVEQDWNVQHTVDQRRQHSTLIAKFGRTQL